jgi:hypothetical protein
MQAFIAKKVIASRRQARNRANTRRRESMVSAADEGDGAGVFDSLLANAPSPVYWGQVLFQAETNLLRESF